VLRASAGADDTVTAFSDVVPAIYGAALIPVSWPLALCRIGSFNAESASSFCTKETSRRFYFVRKAPSVESVGATLSDGDVDLASTNGRFAAQEVTAAIVLRSIVLKKMSFERISPSFFESDFRHCFRQTQNS
jgi:hypothetical protein